MTLPARPVDECVTVYVIFPLIKALNLMPLNGDTFYVVNMSCLAFMYQITLLRYSKQIISLKPLLEYDISLAEGI